MKFLSGVFSPLTSEACEKSDPWFWTGICVSTGVIKSQETCVSPTATLAVKVVLNPNTTTTEKEPF